MKLFTSGSAMCERSPIEKGNAMKKTLMAIAAVATLAASAMAPTSASAQHGVDMAAVARWLQV